MDFSTFAFLISVVKQNPTPTFAQDVWLNSQIQVTQSDQMVFFGFTLWGAPLTSATCIILDELSIVWMIIKVYDGKYIVWYNALPVLVSL